MRTRTVVRSRATALSLAAVMALGVSGCGDTQSASTSGSDATSANKQATAVQAAAVGEELMVDAYEAAMKAGSVHLSMKASGRATASAEGDIAYDDGAPAMQMTASMAQLGAGKMSMRFVDGMLYLQVPGMTPAGKFLAMDPKDESSPLGKGLAGFTEQLDPLASVKQMQGAITKSEKVGESTIDGVAVDDYEVTVDTEKLAAKLDTKAPMTGMPKSVTYQLSLDEQQLIRKMSFELAGASIEVLLSKWGEPVQVEKPAPGDIARGPVA